MKTIKRVSDIIEAEAEYLDLKNKETKRGLAISGGGIRSASFGLGVMQALVANKELERIDYMSTVSGGGYLGGALTWALKQGKGEAGTKSENFPLGKIKAASRIDTEAAKGNNLLDYIRQHGNYLTPTSSLDLISAVAVMFRSIILSLTVYFSLLLLLMTGLIFANQLVVKIPDTYFLDNSFLLLCFKGLFLPLGLALILLLIYLLLSVFYSFGTLIPALKNYTKYKSFLFNQKVNGYIWKTVLVFAVLGSVHYVAILFGDALELIWTSSASTIFGTLVGIWQYTKAQKGDTSSSKKSDLLIYVGAIALIYGMLVLAYALSNKFILPEVGFNYVLFIAVVAIAFFLGFFTNLNLLGPSRIWRNRLMETFMPNKRAVENNKWEAASEANKAAMHEMCSKEENCERPYHLINTNLVLVDSAQTKYRNRGGDNFIISPLFCGSDASKWVATKDYLKRRSGISLATAVATSAAAVNPNTGVSGEGVTRNSTVSILLSLLNLRLGFWTDNPMKKPNKTAPNFFSPGFKELTRSGLNEENKDIQISDGGHFENLGIYELIRRKLDLIIVSDGGFDSGFNFDDLANAIEKVRVDFNAKIKFRADFDMDKMLPNSAGTEAYNKKYEISKHAFGIADIYYHDGSKGVLVYLKLAMIKGLATDVYSYKGVYPDFPHQSTADQFFNEKQFEAYRELGYHVCWQMMETNPCFDSETNKGYIFQYAEKRG